MIIKNKCLYFSAMMSLVMLSSQAYAICPENTISIDVKGEIYNNSIAPGTTLGTVHLTYGNNKKLKCGITGNGGAGPDGALNFIHTLVCDDKFDTGINNETIHSQLTLNTSGYGTFQLCDPNNFEGGVYGTFREISMPLFGRGIFQNVTAGEIKMGGNINCQFAVDMEFKGYLCLLGQ